MVALLLIYAEFRTDMSAEEAEKAKKKAWIEILIGVPALIGLIYLMFYILQRIGR